jgi:uncharacterized membrane protein
MESLLKQFSEIAALGLQGLAVVLIAYGALEAFIILARNVALGHAAEHWRKDLFVRFGMWLILGLQYALAADIVSTVIAPTWNDIGQLAAIALIRTFLNYFLERDLTEAEEEVKGVVGT